VRAATTGPRACGGGAIGEHRDARDAAIAVRRPARRVGPHRAAARPPFGHRAAVARPSRFDC
jgi:hypothetical protein